VIFDTRCFVAFSDAHGVGLRFLLDAAGMAELHDAVALLSTHPRRALVIDDDSLPRQLVADALVERGFEVLTASDAREGLHLLAEEALAIDLLVTDLILPGFDGEELVATIRRAGGESDLVVVVMTGRPDAGLARRLQAAGADLLVGKDLGPELIAAKADDLLEAAHLGRGPTRAHRGVELPLAAAVASRAAA
jgi:CheY-like chemotaxis protein